MIYFMESEISEAGVYTRYLDLAALENADDWILEENWQEQVCSVPEADYFPMAIKVANQAKLKPVKNYPETCAVNIYSNSQQSEKDGHYFVRTMIIN